MKQENGLSMIIIDYLQLMSGSGGRSSDSRQQEGRTKDTNFKTVFGLLYRPQKNSYIA